ncbi:polysaccharide pyruvyl transferase family protein [Kocuria sp. M1R5S2]|uniref:polysaccharide pyruvyl transferase family protein n=1 Tax=Kocuria rhizosphaerae TaxID=3376285 RepID=UPI00378F58B6
MTTSVYAHMSYVNREDGNLGDKMGFHIADWMIGPNAYERIGMRDAKRIDEHTVALVGSVIAALVDKKCRIIGGGLINGNSRRYDPDLAITGVRGFLTKALIQRDSPHHRPEVIGDPGLLVSDIEPLPHCRRPEPLGFIVHDVDREAFAQKYPDHVQHIVDNYAPLESFVRQLSRYRSIASTSLHGCIFSHAYGIPVAPFVLTDKVYGGDFKFEDYYSSYGLNVSRATLRGDVARIAADIVSAPQPDMSQVFDLKMRQRELISAAFMPQG